MQSKFGFVTHARQTCAIAGTAFGTIAKSVAGLVLVAGTMLVVLFMPVLMSLRGISMVPRTALVLSVLTAPVAKPQAPWVLIPLLIVFYAGELVWRERDAGLGEIADATPVPEWVHFLGRFLGLTLALVAWVALLMTAGVLGQMRMGYFDFVIGLYLKILFGLQLIDYVLFALLAFVVHAVVNHKHLGYLVALIAYGIMLFPSDIGIEHHLLIYGSDPGWSYSDIRGFGGSLEPWLWFKLYWIAWAVLLAVAAMLLWPRGTERSVWHRLRAARRRFNRATVGVAATAMALIVTLGGFIFYNTNVLNRTASGRSEQRAEYERRYGKYDGVARPSLMSTNLRVEIYPERSEMEIYGTYILANTSSVAMDSVHVTTIPGVQTEAVSLDRPASPVLTDNDLGYRIYALEKPLAPGDSLQLRFELHVAPHGFRNEGADTFVVQNGSYFTNVDCLPSIGYQRSRELNGVRLRKQYGLASRPNITSLDDTSSRRVRVGGDPMDFEAIIGTNGDQIAVAPGALRRIWTEGGRRYFHYVADVPINNSYGVYSAKYVVLEDLWQASQDSGKAVAIRIFHHPMHDASLDRMVASVRASLDQYTRQYGPYPYSYLNLIEKPGSSFGVQTEAATIEYGERFSFLKKGDGPQGLDPVFSVVAHGVARGWWGMQVAPAAVEGSGLLTTGLETYSGMRVVEDTLGTEQLRRYLDSLRQENGIPRSRAARPLLRASDSFASSRRGPFALFTLSRYIGKEKVDDALRNLLKDHGSGISRAAPLATSLDLYRELQMVTPDQFRPLLHDLFEVNTFWEFEMERATGAQTAAGAWQVVLEVNARKVAVDETGVETKLPMDDWTEIGVFGEGEPYLQKHRIRSGQQRITVIVPRKPTRAGIDPNELIDLTVEDNVKAVKIGS